MTPNNNDATNNNSEPKKTRVSLELLKEFNEKLTAALTMIKGINDRLEDGVEDHKDHEGRIRTLEAAISALSGGGKASERLFERAVAVLSLGFSAGSLIVLALHSH